MDDRRQYNIWGHFHDKSEAKENKSERTDECNMQLTNVFYRHTLM